MSGVYPYSPHGRLLCRVLDQIAVLFPKDQGRPAQLAVTALSAAVEHDPSGPEVRSAWDRVVTELAGLEGGCVAGPLPALVFENMVRDSPLKGGLLDTCLAHAVDQAGLLLPDHDGWEHAVEDLIAQVERADPDLRRVCAAVGTVSYALSYMIVTSTGGAVAELVWEWLHDYACTEPMICGCLAS